MTAEQILYQNLPARIPDLVIHFRDKTWNIQEISRNLARLLEIFPGDFYGTPVHQVLGQSVPSLSDLANEVINHKNPISGIHIRLLPNKPHSKLTASLQPVPETDGSKAAAVQFFFQELALQAAETPQDFQGMVGVSPAILEVFRKVSLYGPSDASVVITGETGTGKELVARALHNVSPRSARPYVAVNCSAISKELLESELFGHEKGAFTGALRSHKGRFERAEGGSIFLDEVGDMPPATQVKLLRVLENRTIERVGAESETPIDVRVICATNVTFEKEVAAGRFRSDLYHRLAILRIHLPPLRGRVEDIPFLASHFLEELNSRYGKTIRRLTLEALSLLQAYLWPGNIRELRNVLERVVVETESEVIGARAFREWIRERQQLSPERWKESNWRETSSKTIIPPFPLTTERPLLAAPEEQVVEMEILPSNTHTSKSTVPFELDEEAVRRTYREADGNISEVARRLGVHRATIYRYLRKLGLVRKDLDS